MTFPEHKNIEGLYTCNLCGAEVFLEDGFWGCECYQIGAYEFDCDVHEIPKFWVRKEE